MVSFAALCASDFLLIPLESADYGARGVTQVTEAYHYVREHFNPELRLLGYVVSRFKAARSVQQSYLAQLRKHFGHDALDTVIPDSASYERSIVTRVPIVISHRHSRPAAIARDFVDELDRRAAAYIAGCSRHGRGSPRATVRRFKTARAVVTVHFRQKDVTVADILAALDDARHQVIQSDSASDHEI